MTRKGHIIVGAAAGIISFFVTQEIVFSVAVFLGANAPDVLEISYRDDNGYKGYSRLINHRTITHWFPIWIGLWFLVDYLTPMVPGLVQTLVGASLVDQFSFLKNIDYWLELLAKGYICGAFIHIITDFFSPTGVPILTPFAKSRKRLVLYTTGKSEIPFISGILGIGLAFVLVNI